MTWETAIWITVALPPGMALLLHVWLHQIRPCFIPAHRIEAMADLMLAAFGPYAEHDAFLRQREAWYHGDHFAQGVWMRVRRRLRRRWAHGKIKLYDGDEVGARARCGA